MTRKEEIKEMAEITASHITSDKDMQVAFADALRRGAEWADTHPHWISVEEELPKDSGDVLALTKGGKMLVTLGTYDEGEWVWCFYSPKDYITHWMPLPSVEPLKEKKL